MRDKNYNDEYKKIVLESIPEESRLVIEQKDPNELNKLVTSDLKTLSSDLNPKNARKVPKVIVFVNFLFNQMNIINDENIPIIFINCSGNVNITMNNQKEIANLRRIVCPPPENPTTKLVGTAVAAVVVTVIVYSAILHFRK